jgi:hypothetical protein
MVLVLGMDKTLRIVNCFEVTTYKHAFTVTFRDSGYEAGCKLTFQRERINSHTSARTIGDFFAVHARTL